MNKPDEMPPRRTEEHIPGDLTVDKPEDELSLVSGCFKGSVGEMPQRGPALPVKSDDSLEVLAVRRRLRVPYAGREGTRD
ncbi:hypothetical protein GCM10025863_02440 [Microbacterium suwonense]|uniref:Uncharacterized protein n=1 Tax=Microbacterium suwonense TaxID=683047 RepID=A0ABN6WYL8_9MICO|nr:hypothetical protein GCM10025863_02440 [Microbacterium suwonense]